MSNDIHMLSAWYARQGEDQHSGGKNTPSTGGGVAGCQWQDAASAVSGVVYTTLVPVTGDGAVRYEDVLELPLAVVEALADAIEAALSHSLPLAKCP